MSGSVASVDGARGVVTVAFRGANSLGDHVSGTAELVLPGGSSYPDRSNPSGQERL